MPIDLTCPCGKLLRVRNELAGRQGQCPVCGRVLAIPPADAFAAPSGLLLGEALLATAVEEPVGSAEPASQDYAEAPLASAPAVPLPEGPAVHRPEYKLFAPGHVGLAAFLGGPVGAFAILAINYFRLGKPRAAWGIIACGLIACAALMRISLALPEGAPGFLFALPLFLVLWGLAKGLQGHAYGEHVRQGGETASGGAAAGLGLLGAGLYLGVFLGVYLGYEQLASGNKIDFGSGEEIYYAQGATEADARALGASLRDVGFFDGRGPKAVRLSCVGNRMVVAFVVQDWVLNDPRAQQGFRTIARQAADRAFNGRPVEVQLCDEYFEVKKRME
jgi:hypothetical protein